MKLLFYNYLAKVNLLNISYVDMELNYGIIKLTIKEIFKKILCLFKILLLQYFNVALTQSGLTKTMNKNKKLSNIKSIKN